MHSSVYSILKRREWPNYNASARGEDTERHRRTTPRYTRPYTHLVWNNKRMSNDAIVGVWVCVCVSWSVKMSLLLLLLCWWFSGYQDTRVCVCKGYVLIIGLQLRIAITHTHLTRKYVDSCSDVWAFGVCGFVSSGPNAGRRRHLFVIQV